MVSESPVQNESTSLFLFVLFAVGTPVGIMPEDKLIRILSRYVDMKKSLDDIRIKQLAACIPPQMWKDIQEMLLASLDRVLYYDESSTSTDSECRMFEIIRKWTELTPNVSMEAFIRVVYRSMLSVEDHYLIQASLVKYYASHKEMP